MEKQENELLWEDTWKATEARGAVMPLYSAEGPSEATMLRRSRVAETFPPSPPAWGCWRRILSVSSGKPEMTPAMPPSPPATNSLPQLLARNSGQNSIPARSHSTTNPPHHAALINAPTGAAL